MVFNAVFEAAFEAVFEAVLRARLEAVLKAVSEALFDAVPKPVKLHSKQARRLLLNVAVRAAGGACADARRLRGHLALVAARRAAFLRLLESNAALRPASRRALDDAF